MIKSVYHVFVNAISSDSHGGAIIKITDAAKVFLTNDFVKPLKIKA